MSEGAAPGPDFGKFGRPHEVGGIARMVARASLPKTSNFRSNQRGQLWRSTFTCRTSSYLRNVSLNRTVKRRCRP